MPFGMSHFQKDIYLGSLKRTHRVAAALLAGPTPVLMAASKSAALDALLRNFYQSGRTYWRYDEGGRGNADSLLKGTATNPECGGLVAVFLELARMAELVGPNEGSIGLYSIPPNREKFITATGLTTFDGRTGNLNNQRWVFENHKVVVVDGRIFDPLFSAAATAGTNVDAYMRPKVWAFCEKGFVARNGAQGILYRTDLTTGEYLSYDLATAAYSLRQVSDQEILARTGTVKSILRKGTFED